MIDPDGKRIARSAPPIDAALTLRHVVNSVYS
jgi:hypothetical protein